METRRTANNSKDLNRSFDVRCDATNTMVRRGVGGREGNRGGPKRRKTVNKIVGARLKGNLLNRNVRMAVLHFAGIIPRE